MRIHYFQHVPHEGLGNIEEWIKAGKHKLSCTRFYAGDLPPALDEIDMLIIMGGPMGAYEDKKYSWLAAEKIFIREAIAAGKSVLGICLGAQLIASALGVEVYPHIHKEIGWFPVQLTPEGIESVIFKGIPTEFSAFHWHGDTFGFPDGAKRLAESEACRNQAFAFSDWVLGLQFHWDVKQKNIEEWIKSGSDELVQEPYIQTAQEMLSQKDQFAIIQKYMNKILDYFATRGLI